jgi:hypothetical protein
MRIGAGPSGFPGAGLDQPQHFAGLGVAPQGQLGEYELPVDCHLEGAAGAFHQPNPGIGEALPDLGRQTGSPRLVVSDDAVLDRDLHHRSESMACPS